MQKNDDERSPEQVAEEVKGQGGLPHPVRLVGGADPKRPGVLNMDDRDHHIKSISKLAKTAMGAKDRQPLKEGFKPGPMDVICGRGAF